MFFGYTDPMLGFTTQMFEYTVLAHIFQSNNARISLIKIFTLSTDSVTKKITIVRAAYFYYSGLIFATKKI